MTGSSALILIRVDMAYLVMYPADALRDADRPPFGIAQQSEDAGAALEELQRLHQRGSLHVRTTLIVLTSFGTVTERVSGGRNRGVRETDEALACPSGGGLVSERTRERTARGGTDFGQDNVSAGKVSTEQDSQGILAAHRYSQTSSEYRSEYCFLGPGQGSRAGMQIVLKAHMDSVNVLVVCTRSKVNADPFAGECNASRSELDDRDSQTGSTGMIATSGCSRPSKQLMCAHSTRNTQ